MNRREFLKSVMAATLATSLDLENLLDETQHLSDQEFVAYYKWQMIFLVDNPRQCVRIDWIEDT